MAISDKRYQWFLETFPELRGLGGRFQSLFLNNLWEEFSKKIEDWAIWARLELGNKKCDKDFYPTSPVICPDCSHFKNNSCKKYPNLGQTWEGDPKHQPADLSYPNNPGRDWYWWIIECPDFKKSKKSKRLQIDDDIPF